jgi:hypothetical protein
MTSPQFPRPIYREGRLLFLEYEAQDYLRALAGLPILKRNEKDAIRLITAAKFARDMGSSRRTVNRRLREIEKSAAVA